jgi:hypothetical protein
MALRPDLCGASPITPDLRQNDGLMDHGADGCHRDGRHIAPGVLSNKNILQIRTFRKTLSERFPIKDRLY